MCEVGKEDNKYTVEDVMSCISINY